MDAERWRRAAEVFEAALDRPEPDQRTYVQQVCADDAELLREVEALIQEDRRASPLDTPLSPDTIADLSSLRKVIGPYTLDALLGVGGMGEVYRARDARLGRDVAIKILPAVFAGDRERLARFKREAQVLASLNHPNIASIYGFEADGGVEALVLELVEGPTLADRLAGGALPAPEALAIAHQIAEALAAAHAAGVVHRDLKPANVKVREDGMVKVLDFGLAKIAESTRTGVRSAMESPTITTPAMTAAGIILGTAAYMSPEQAKGKAADHRSDVWAFGCVLYEMLTGRRAFEGGGVADTLAAVLRADPAWTALSPDTPQALRRLLHRCLQKDPKLRLQHIGDARLELLEAGDGDIAAPVAETSSTWRRWPLAMAAVIGAGIAGLVGWTLAPRPAPLPVKRFSIQLSATSSQYSQGGGGIALAPDGNTLIYVGGTRPGLLKRPLADLLVQPLRGGEGGTAPFFSPDGDWVGFFADGKLKKVPIGGGIPVEISDAPPNARGSWGDDDTIVVARTHLYKVASSGGSLTVVLKNDADEQFSQPVMLPGSHAVLVTTRKPPASGRIEAIDLQTGTRHALLEGSKPRLAPTGDLLFERQERIWATKFNSTRLAVTGTAVAFGESVAFNGDDAQFAISRDGSLAYIPAAEQAPGSLVWLDRNGTPTPMLNEAVGFQYPRLSPDGKHVSASTSGPAPKLWTFDLARGTRERLTSEGNNRRSVWSPNGKQIAFFSLPAAPQEGATQDLFLVDAAGGTPTRLLERAGPQWPDDWSPDGRFLIFEDGPGGSSRDLWLLPFGQEPRPLVVTRFNERGAVFSPDGKSVAFVSDESGRAEVYVQPFEREGPRTRISVAGGLQPVWGHDRPELFYREGDSLMVLQVQLEPFHASTPRKLIEMPGVLYGRDQFYADYDIGPDGRILAVRQDPRTEIHFVLNWVEELRRALGR